MDRPQLTDADIDAAEERGRTAALTELRAAGALYDSRRRLMVIDLTNGCSFTVHTRSVGKLETASDDEIAEFEIVGIGYGLHWKNLDLDISVAGLFAIQADER